MSVIEIAMGALFRPARRRTNCQGANFTGAILSGVDLRGVDLSQAIGLTRAQLDEARIDDRTRLPDELEAELSAGLVSPGKQAVDGHQSNNASEHWERAG